jgi:hypothetical protein
MGPTKLHPEDIVAEHLHVRETHCFLGLADDDSNVGRLSITLYVKAAKSLALLRRSPRPRYNGYAMTRQRVAAENQFGRESSAEAVLGGKTLTGKSLQHGALPGRLISAYDNFRQRDIVAEPLTSQPIDDVEEISVFAGLKHRSIHDSRCLQPSRQR